ncbi:MAG: hypothetical protein GTO63_23385 [Anaerolineae bacterium]|nr:hypothetical protein [Anaerolineae bacterium]NIN97685.1 hypothetical protein [Anaerolineae bacterium]NIQ80668.1 hypothetical protein [Anaerolineae bacterium]
MIRRRLSSIWNSRRLVVAACFLLSLLCSVVAPIAIGGLGALILGDRLWTGFSSPPARADVIGFYLFFVSFLPALTTVFLVCSGGEGACLDRTTNYVAWGSALGMQITLWFAVICIVVLYIRHVTRATRDLTESPASRRWPWSGTVKLPVLCAASLPLSFLCSVAAPIGLLVLIVVSGDLHGQGGGLWAFPGEPDQLIVLGLLLLFIWPALLAGYVVSRPYGGFDTYTPAEGAASIVSVSLGAHVLFWLAATCIGMFCLAYLVRRVASRIRSSQTKPA